MTLATIVLLPFVCAVLPLIADRHGRRACAWTTAAVPAAGLALLMSCAARVFSGEVIAVSVPWLPQLGLNLTLRVDGLAFLFAALILAIGLLIVLYARYYLAPTDPMGRFFAFLLVFMGAMLGVALAGNLLLMFVFWELTSLSSFLLIGYWRHRPDARGGARMALAITGGGGLALLAGLVLVWSIVGSLELDHVFEARDRLQAHPAFPVALTLILLGAFTKSAQFPFHFWLPHAMAAPTPVSAYLHSATMVKAGVFLLARLYPALGGNDLWFFLVSGTGLVTLVFASYVALFQHDLKGLLAYSTVSHLGLITLLFGLDAPLAVMAGVFHLINHATFKASLFMAAGIIDHESGSRDMRQLNGLWRHMPVTGTLAMIASAAMAGVPLLNGFLSKEMFLAETLAIEGHDTYRVLVPVGATIAGAFAVAYSIRFVHDVFFNGEPVGLTRTPHEPPRWMRVPVELLAVICIVVGVLPAVTVEPLLDMAARPVLGGVLPEHTISLWHGFNLPLAMSVTAIAGGAALYFGLQRWVNLHRVEPGAIQAKTLYDMALAVLVWLCARMSGWAQNGSLQRYLALLVLTALLAGFAPFAERGFALGSVALTPISAGATTVWLLTLFAALTAVLLHRRRLTALIATGAVGLFVSLAFVHFSAPDLALTQLAVEVVTILLLLLGLWFLPQESRPESGTGRRVRDAVIAMLAGVGVTALAAAALTRPHSSIAGYFLAKSLPEGGGANVVNVIIVDFRGFDTLGEILVLAIAAFAIHALLRGVRPPAGWQPPFAVDPGEAPLMLQLLARSLLAFALVVAAYLFLRGHNAPGGGFVAGLVAAVALLVQYVANGRAWTEARVPPRFGLWIGLGMVAAVVTGLASWLFAHPFLTSSTPYVDLPLIGEVPFASAMGFDLGVFLVVTGSVMLMLVSFVRVAGRAPDRAGTAEN